MDALEIKYLEINDDPRWDLYVKASESATFFHRSGWKTVIESAFGHKCYYIYAEKAGKIVGILPLGHVNSFLFGNALISTPFCVYGGPVYDSEQIKDKLIDEAVNLAKRLKVDYLELRNRTPSCKDWLRKDLYVTFRRAIDPDVEINLKNIPRKQRAMVRKGIEAQLSSSWDDTVDNLYNAYSQSVRALGTPVFSKSYFNILKRTFSDDCAILSINKNGKTIASVMNFYFKNEVLPYYGGGTTEARAYKGNDYMYWELMRSSCEQGLQTFDFGRSKKDSGSYSFKKNWGFEPEPLHYEYFLVNSTHLPDVSPVNPKYKLFIQVWKKLPLFVTNWLGPKIAKYLG